MYTDDNVKRFISQNQLRKVILKGNTYFLNVELPSISRLYEADELKKFQEKREFKIDIKDDEQLLLISTKFGDIYGLNGNTTIFTSEKGSKGVSREKYLREEQPKLLQKVPLGGILKIMNDCEEVFSNGAEIAIIDDSDELYVKQVY